MKSRRVVATLAACWALALTVSAWAPQTAARAPAAPAPAAAAAPAPTTDDCLACHDDNSLKRAHGTPLTVAKAAFGASVHGPLACVDCHADLAKAEPPLVDAGPASRRARLIGRLIGTTAVVVGMSLVALILYAVATQL